MRRLVIEADGGSRGNPGPAGYGAVVRDAASSAVLARRNGFLGRVTNNVAEYRGLIAGLQAAATIDVSASVEVRLDSKLLVEQMSGRWQVKHPDMRPLAREASSLASTFSEIRFTWIPRAQNVEADKLANEAMDARRSTYDELDDLSSVPEDYEGPDELPLSAEDRDGRPGWRDPSGVPPTSLVLLRHGQTVHSIDRRFSGSSDPGLTDLGRRQAGQAAERLATMERFDAIVTSPRRRARETAQAAGAALGLTPFVDDAWRECDFGAFEGLTWAEANKQYPQELAAWLADPAVTPPGGESFVQVTERVSAAQHAMTEGAAGQRILVVSHVTPIKVVGRLALEAPPTALYALHLDLASITRIDFYADGPTVLRAWNDAAHVEGLS